MFKKLLLAVLLMGIGLWGAGYDLVAIKNHVWQMANSQAAEMTGRSRIDDSDWGSDAI